jgi:hypothetical protein
MKKYTLHEIFILKVTGANKTSPEAWNSPRLPSLHDTPAVRPHYQHSLSAVQADGHRWPGRRPRRIRRYGGWLIVFRHSPLANACSDFDAVTVWYATRPAAALIAMTHQAVVGQQLASEGRFIIGSHLCRAPKQAERPGAYNNRSGS